MWAHLSQSNTGHHQRILFLLEAAGPSLQCSSAFCPVRLRVHGQAQARARWRDSQGAERQRRCWPGPGPQDNASKTAGRRCCERTEAYAAGSRRTARDVLRLRQKGCTALTRCAQAYLSCVWLRLLPEHAPETSKSTYATHIENSDTEGYCCCFMVPPTIGSDGWMVWLGV